MREDEEVAAILDEALQVIDFSGCKCVLGGGDDEEIGFLDLLEVNGLFIKADLGVTHSYLVALLVFFQEFL